MGWKVKIVKNKKIDKEHKKGYSIGTVVGWKKNTLSCLLFIS